MATHLLVALLQWRFLELLLIIVGMKIRCTSLKPIYKPLCAGSILEIECVTVTLSLV